jgi:hypothetical protein
VDFYRGGTFRGLVVADTVGFVYDRTMIRGAMVTLSRSPAAVTSADGAAKGPLKSSGPA